MKQQNSVSIKLPTFLEGGEHMISQMEENSFDGTEVGTEGLTI